MSWDRMDDWDLNLFLGRIELKHKSNLCVTVLSWTIPYHTVQYDIRGWTFFMSAALIRFLSF